MEKAGLSDLLSISASHTCFTGGYLLFLIFFISNWRTVGYPADGDAPAAANSTWELVASPCLWIYCKSTTKGCEDRGDIIMCG